MSTGPSNPPPGENHDPVIKRYLARHDVPCIDCGYNLRGLDSTDCPECGAWTDIEAILKSYQESETPENLFQSTPFLCIIGFFITIPLQFGANLYAGVFGMKLGLILTGGIPLVLPLPLSNFSFISAQVTFFIYAAILRGAARYKYAGTAAIILFLIHYLSVILFCFLIGIDSYDVKRFFNNTVSVEGLLFFYLPFISIHLILYLLANAPASSPSHQPGYSKYKHLRNDGYPIPDIIATSARNSMRSKFNNLAQTHNARIRLANSTTQILDILKNCKPRLLLLDGNHESIAPWSVIEKARSIHNTLPIIVFLYQPTKVQRDRLLKIGADRVLSTEQFEKMLTKLVDPEFELTLPRDHVSSDKQDEP